MSMKSEALWPGSTIHCPAGIWFSHIPPALAYLSVQLEWWPLSQKLLRRFSKMLGWKLLEAAWILPHIFAQGLSRHLPFVLQEEPWRVCTHTHVPSVALTLANPLPSQATLSTILGSTSLKCCSHTHPLWSQNSNQFALLGQCCPILTSFRCEFNHS